MEDGAAPQVTPDMKYLRAAGDLDPSVVRHACTANSNLLAYCSSQMRGYMKHIFVSGGQDWKWLASPPHAEPPVHHTAPEVF